MQWLLIGLVGALLPAAPLQDAAFQDTAFQDGANKPDEQAKFRAKLAKKQAKKFIEAGGWRLDYDKERAAAASKDKLLFIYFTRSFAP